MNKMGSQCLGLVFLAVVALLVLASYMTFFRRVDPARDASHVRVKITGNVTSEIFQEAIDQVPRKVKDKGDVFREFDDGELKWRAKHARDVCSTLNSPNISLDNVSYYKHLNLLYCYVPKVATKFWFRALHILETDGKKSPFEIEYGRKELITDQGSGTDEEIRAIIQSAYKIVFTRDPYQRIFSAYVDKFLSPNPLFWSFGKGIIKRVRKPQPKTLGCGEDVTFREVIRYLTGINIELFDFHFRPVSSQCDVCHIQYDVIGKVETFEHDAMYIFNQTQASERGMIVKNFKEESNIHNIIFKVHRAFSFKNRSLECISDHMVHRRLWRVLQISGLINKYDDYPLSPDESRQANETMIMNLVLRAYERSTPEAKLNKQEALLQAYSQIPLVGLEELRLKYLKDLMLFDYEQRPSYLFDKGKANWMKGPGRDATHVGVEIVGNVTDETSIFREANHQVHRKVEDKGDVFLEFYDGELKSRAKHARDVCSTLNTPNISLDNVSYYKHLNLLYCSVPKVATKFWFRALHILETGEKKSPFEIKYGPKKPMSHQGSGTDEEIRAIIQSAYKIVFTRDPYQRIFSAYVDKFLSPNPYFWSYGKRIIRKRGKPRPGCGEDVTFREVIRYLTRVDSESYNRHFRPVSSQCDVCHIQYDVIGKVETFEHDAMYIFNQTQASERGMIVKNFKEESNIHNIIFKVHRAFSCKNRSLECISDHMVHRRLWRVLQISGLINKYDDYPLSPDESRQANETMIMNLVLRAYERSTPEAKLNKQEALLQAYSQIPLVGLEELRLKYLKDLILFDYEQRPSYLFDKGKANWVKSPDSFDYFDVLTLKE